MLKVNVQQVSEKERVSPQGQYHAYMKEVSVALGREPNSLNLAKRHPFDLALMRVPPGKKFGLYHAHSAQWELYVVVSGVGSVRYDDGVIEVFAGDAFLFGPNEAHQMINHGQEDFVYYVVADNPIGGSCYYPDSKKWMVSLPTHGLLLKGRETNYFEDEE